MAETSMATETFVAEGAGECEPLDFQDFEDEIRELICPKETKQVALLRTLSGDIEQIQADEILALKAIFEDDLRMVDESTAKYFKIKINPIAEECHDDEVVDLWFCLPSQYPVIPPIFEIEGHGSLSSAKADKLYSLLMKEACSRLNTLMIYDLIAIAQEFVQETMKEVRERRKTEELSRKDEKPKKEETKSDNEETWDEYKDYGDIDLRDTQRYIGHIHHVLEKVPSHLKIQSLENIMKYNLVRRFNSAWEKMSVKYEKESRKHRELYVTKPKVAFHGTRKGNIPNIVRNGLLVPGGKSGVEVAHGSSLGVGIYLSPSPEYSFNYCDMGGKVLVCAVLQGHVRSVDSAFSRSCKCDCITCGDEMVIFDARHVLPCYVITLVPRDSQVSVDENVAKTLQKTRETKDERLQRITAKAKKFFPYGFGPGDRVQILDAADSDDDEDEGGSYQNERFEDIQTANEYQNEKDMYYGDY
ncbi:uncharacterized protein LOC114530286 isoform X2 [Dendronephthya gigantea]|nr:uncharacterized protein LOC114530286 isoform X2 [Dendronephthya gigantea]